MSGVGVCVAVLMSGVAVLTRGVRGGGDEVVWVVVLTRRARQQGRDTEARIAQPQSRNSNFGASQE